jgi:S-adenosylmethionine:tRNA ribosyltransferase-isomerase
MLVDEFDFDLPPGLIAQKPAARRDASRLMVLDRKTGSITHRVFADLPEYLSGGDVLVINDTKVVPARVEGVKPTGGRVEALILEDLGLGSYLAIVKGGLKAGAHVTVGGMYDAVVEKDLGGGRKVLCFKDPDGFRQAMDEIGRMPLPPYIDPKGRDEAHDRERYQTVYARTPGAVAAPTAGLHFTPSLIGSITGRGVCVAAVTLHVGPGTFMPVREDVVERHVMEEEEYEVPGETADIVTAAIRDGRRVVAVGTTSTRTLESACQDGVLKPGKSRTGIFIYPGYNFKAVGALITNFHLPKSTLLMLVCAFAGREKIMAAYGAAVQHGYRFYSYGDAMLII